MEWAPSWQQLPPPALASAGIRESARWACLETPGHGRKRVLSSPRLAWHGSLCQLGKGAVRAWFSWGPWGSLSRGSTAHQGQRATAEAESTGPLNGRRPLDALASPLPALFPLGQGRGLPCARGWGLELANPMASLFSNATQPNLEGTLLRLEPGLLSPPRRVQGGRLLCGGGGGETLTLPAASAPPPQGGGHPQESGAVGAEPPGWQRGARNRLSRASRDSSLEFSRRVAKSCFLPHPSPPPFHGSRVAPEGAGEEGPVARKDPCFPPPSHWSWCQAGRGRRLCQPSAEEGGHQRLPYVGREGMPPNHALIPGCPVLPALWPFWPSTEKLPALPGSI